MDWGEQSPSFDEIKKSIGDRDLVLASEAQTRFDVIDRLIKEVLGWTHGQISVEEPTEGNEKRRGFVDYILRLGDVTAIIEAKKVGSSFPTPTRNKKLKLGGTVLSEPTIKDAIDQAVAYAKDKIAQLTVVTNGFCWIVFETREVADDGKEPEALVFFPFSEPFDAERLFNALNAETIATKGLSLFHDDVQIAPDNRLLNIVRDSETRVDRNNIADHLNPALDRALYSEAVINNPDLLRDFYVKTTVRTKFDATLNIYLADIKPKSIEPALRIKPDKEHDHIEKMVEQSSLNATPPVTLIIAPVGVGKSTYLNHFRLVEGRAVLEKMKAHWIYIDFYSMGKTANVREFIYKNLRDYLLDDTKKVKTDFENAVRPAYKSEIEGLKQGPLAFIRNNPEEFEKKITDHIYKDFESVEPYVDKMFAYLSQETLCILVLDNIDLYEDDELEKTALSEGLAISKRLCCHTIISIRDTTFVKHKDDAWLDAFELKKLWLDPPPFREVLSRRLAISKNILDGKHVKLSLSNGIQLDVPDLGVFFEIVRRSVLSGSQGDFLELMSSLNIRKGLGYIRNFLTSGHIQGDKALKLYMKGDTKYAFPFHEVFKGSILGQYKYYKENRVDCANLFDSKLNAASLRLLRLLITSFLQENARHEKTVEVPIERCIEIFSKLGATTTHILTVVDDLIRFGIAKTTNVLKASPGSVAFITQTGSYYLQYLATRMVYVESCMYDTHIEDETTWRLLVELTTRIESEGNLVKRMEFRKERMKTFLSYLDKLEKDAIENIKMDDPYMRNIGRVEKQVRGEFEIALRSTRRNYAE